MAQAVMGSAAQHFQTTHRLWYTETPAPAVQRTFDNTVTQGQPMGKAQHGTAQYSNTQYTAGLTLAKLAVGVGTPQERLTTAAEAA